MKFYNFRQILYFWLMNQTSRNKYINFGKGISLEKAYNKHPSHINVIQSN